MAVTSTPVFVQTPKAAVVTLSTSYQTIVTGATNGTKVVGLVATSTDASARVVTVAVDNATTQFILGATSVPANAGTDGTTAAVDLFGSTLNPGLPVDNDGQHYILLPAPSPTFTLKVKVASGTSVQVVAIFGDF